MALKVGASIVPGSISWLAKYLVVNCWGEGGRGEIAYPPCFRWWDENSRIFAATSNPSFPPCNALLSSYLFKIQWNLSNPDTNRTEVSIYILWELFLGREKVLIREFTRFRGVLRERTGHRFSPYLAPTSHLPPYLAPTLSRSRSPLHKTTVEQLLFCKRGHLSKTDTFFSSLSDRIWGISP